MSTAMVESVSERLKSKLARDDAEKQQRFDDLAVDICNGKKVADATIQKILDDVDKKPDGLVAAVKALENRHAKSLVANNLDVIREQLTAAQAEREAEEARHREYIAESDERLAELSRDEKAAAGARRTLLSTAPGWLKRERTAINNALSKLRRELEVPAIPPGRERELTQGLTQDNRTGEWHPLQDTEKHWEQHHRLNNRLLQHAERQEELREEIEILNRQHEEIKQLALMPAPKRGDMEKILGVDNGDYAAGATREG